MHWLSAVLAIAFLGFGSMPALACEIDPPTVQLPDETAMQFEERAKEALSEWFAIQKYLRETDSYSKASTIYLGRLVSLEGNFAGPKLPTAIVQPIHAIRGRLPERTVTLSAPNTCGFGDGEATSASIGDILIVFEGVPKTYDRPNGLDSFRASSIRTDELLQPLAKFLGKEIGW